MRKFFEIKTSNVEFKDLTSITTTIVYTNNCSTRIEYRKIKQFYLKLLAHLSTAVIDKLKFCLDNRQFN